jgi:putative endonuclease
MSTSKPSPRKTASGGSPERHNRRYGTRGEDLAARWYVEQGYDIVARNWRCRDGEVDLVAARRGEVIFCEVKARSSDRFGLPAEAVTPAKQRRLRRLAALFLAAAAEPGSGLAVPRGAQPRFDVVAVLGGRVEVIEAAF